MRPVGYGIAVGVIAGACVAYSFVRIPFDQANWVVFAVLLIGAVLYAEAARSIEREQRATVSANSVWIFAGVLLLHPGTAAVLIASCHAAGWLRSGRKAIRRHAFNASAAIVAGFAASSLLRMTGQRELSQEPAAFGLVVVAAVLFLVVNTALHRKPLRDVLAEPGDFALEAATIGLGVLMAWAITDWPVAAALIAAITLVMHRSVLIRHLQEKARADGKTGLLKPDAWTDSATAALARRDRPASLLMIDIDYFKRVNDEHGHLVGDEVLRTVAATVTSEVRARDLVGRYGGDEFVVLLPGTTAPDALAIAERIRRRVAARSTVDSSVSIGVSVREADGSLRDLLHAADVALYEAKRAGRNRTAMSTA